ncbi:protein-disulfide reductase DsbD family protein [Pseudoduganella namucuonensis]|nr:thioredoxin family protein [Pseudoduganella namucuonensis]
MIALTASAFLAAPAISGQAVIKTDHVRAELLAHAPQGVRPGGQFKLGLLLEHQPHWHTYWSNPGDSGLPTTVSWTLPAGMTAGGIEWPAPRKLPLGPLTNYGYEGKVLLPVTVDVPASYRPAADGKAVEFSLHAEWLVCKEICLPESGDFRLSIPGGVPSTASAALFDAARRARPATLPEVRATARAGAATLALDVQGLPATLRGKELDVFVADAGVIDHAARVAQRWDGGVLRLAIPLSAQRSESPAKMEAVLIHPAVAGGVAVPFAVDGGWPVSGAGTSTAALSAATQPSTPFAASPYAGAAAAQPSTPGPAATPPIASAAMAGAGSGTAADGAFNAGAGAASPSYAPTEPLSITLALAFAGGLLLNLMPCVFPVLALKVFGFAQHAHERRRLAAGGLAYTAGVVLSFLALAAALLALRAGGEQLGWGFQLQSPAIVTLLAALFTLIGLNLAGVFEFGGILPAGVAGLRSRHPMVDDALGGALAVAVASPCTAPFMGAALGATLTQPAPAALATFAALGLGMASPYLLASLWPGLARRIPRPGAWMVRFKVLMAFPMFATVIWLIWVLGQQTGIDGAAAALALLLALAFACWTFGTPAASRWTRGLLAGSGLAVLAAAVAWTGPVLTNVQAAPEAAATVASASSEAGQRWQAWSEAAQETARRQGRPVFVDFTAAWCVTCQFNKRTALADAALLQAFDAKRVLLMRADWTLRDPAITRQLAALGRSGVPVYVLYRPGQPAPQLFSELLTAEQVRSAVATL